MKIDNSNLMLVFFVIIITIIINCHSAQTQRDLKNSSAIKPGIEVLIEQKLDLISNKRVGLITNATGVTHDFRTTIDVLHSNKNVQLNALFGPEHGVRGDIEAGHTVHQYTDPKTGLPVYSLYGRTKKPTPNMLTDIDVLVYDIQDIGSRGYTYIYTMALAMEAAKENGIQFFVLDRPNPIGGELVEGNVLEPEFSSFIGMYPIPYIYGMTVGELARLFNTEFGINCELTVIPMEGWKRSMLYPATGLPWIPTSPHVPHADTPFFVAATGCIGELGVVSEGVGYTTPFEIIGAPWIDGEQLATKLNARNLPGVYFRPMTFKPYYMHFAKQQCNGVQIHITDKSDFSPSITQLTILKILYELFPDRIFSNSRRLSMFEKAYGTDKVRKELIDGTSVEDILFSWKSNLVNFNKIRTKYLIYD